MASHNGQKAKGNLVWENETLREVPCYFLTSHSGVGKFATCNQNTVPTEAKAEQSLGLVHSKEILIQLLIMAPPIHRSGLEKSE